ALESDLQAILARLDLGDLGPNQNALVALGDASLERPDEVAIATGQQPFGQFDDAHLRAERVVHASHLQSDDAAADHQQALRQLELQRAGGIDDARIVRRARQARRLRAGGDDALGEGNLAYGARRVRVGVAGHLDCVRRYEHADAVEHVHLALPRERAQPAGEPLDHRILPLAQLRRIDLRFAEAQAG